MNQGVPFGVSSCPLFSRGKESSPVGPGVTVKQTGGSLFGELWSRSSSTYPSESWAGSRLRENRSFR